MNIVGGAKAPVEMVSFLDPADYLFGLPQRTQQLGSQQGGIFFRSLLAARLFYSSGASFHSGSRTCHRSRCGAFTTTIRTSRSAQPVHINAPSRSLIAKGPEGVTASFSIAFHWFWNALRFIFPFIAESGNCAVW